MITNLRGRVLSAVWMVTAMLMSSPVMLWATADDNKKAVGAKAVQGFTKTADNGVEALQAFAKPLAYVALGLGFIGMLKTNRDDQPMMTWVSRVVMGAGGLTLLTDLAGIADFSSLAF